MICYILTSIALTSIAQPTFELGKKSAELLLERIIQPNQPLQQYTLPVTLVKRDSTIPLK